MKKLFIAVCLLGFLASCKKDSTSPTQTLKDKLLGKWKWTTLTIDVTPQGGATNSVTDNKNANAYAEFKDDNTVDFSNDGSSVSDSHTMSIVDSQSFKFEDDGYTRHITKIDASHLEFYYDFEQSNTVYKYKYVLTK